MSVVFMLARWHAHLRGQTRPPDSAFSTILLVYPNHQARLELLASNELDVLRSCSNNVLSHNTSRVVRCTCA